MIVCFHNLRPEEDEFRREPRLKHSMSGTALNASRSTGQPPSQSHMATLAAKVREQMCTSVAPGPGPGAASP